MVCNNFTAWADTLLVYQQGFLRTSEADKWRWKPAFFYCVGILKIEQEYSPYWASVGTKIIYMKKFFLTTVSALLMACAVNAQTNSPDEATVKLWFGEVITKSKERVQKLQKLCKDYKNSGNENIDAFGENVKKVALFSIANSVQLEELYKREIGESKDGIKDVTIKKPTLEEWLKLAEGLTSEAKGIEDCINSGKLVIEEVKAMAGNVSKETNPMKKAKAAKELLKVEKVVEFSKDVTSILPEENAAKVKAVDQMVKTIKSNKNL